MQSYDKIYVGGKTGPLAIGKFKLSDAGVGWKSLASGEIVTIKLIIGDLKLIIGDDSFGWNCKVVLEKSCKGISVENC